MLTGGGPGSAGRMTGVGKSAGQSDQLDQRSRALVFDNSMVQAAHDNTVHDSGQTLDLIGMAETEARKNQTENRKRV